MNFIDSIRTQIYANHIHIEGNKKELKKEKVAFNVNPSLAELMVYSLK